MKARAARKTFEQLLAEQGLRLEGLTIPQGVAAMLAFYRNERAKDCPPDVDGDMLLYQWGMGHEEEGEFFTLDLTRQLIPGGDAAGENIWQLSLKFYVAPTDPLRAIPSANKWCPRPRPQAVDYFERFIHQSEAYRAVSDTQPVQVELHYGSVG